MPFVKIKLNRMIFFRWENFIDAESDISKYEVCLGTTKEECDEIDFRFVGLKMNYTFTRLKLRHQETYYVTVKGTNNVGMSTLVSSNQINIDLTPPHPVKQLSGVSFDLEEICRNAISEDSCNKNSSGNCQDNFIYTRHLCFFLTNPSSGPVKIISN